MKRQLADLLDIPALQSLLDSLYASSKIPSAIIDNEGKILTGSGWQDACTKFHRAHPDVEKLCVESDRRLIDRVDGAQPAVVRTCPQGLADSATPLVVEGAHVANVFTGQLFLAPPDIGFFRSQAGRYGWDEEAYIEAIRKVPVISEEALRENISFIARLTEMLAETGLRRSREREALREAQRFRMALDHVSAHIYMKDTRFRYVYANRQMLELFGCSAEELVGCDDTRFFPTGIARRLHEIDSRVFLGERTAEEIDVADAEGGRRIYWDVKTPIYEEPGSSAISGLLGISTDITERKQAEEELKESEERLVEAQKVAQLGYYTLDVATGVWTSSKILDDVFGIGDDYRRDLEGWSLLVHPEDRQSMLDYFRDDVLGKMNPFNREYRIVRPSDQCVRWVHGLGKVECDPRCKPVRMIGTIQDVSERRQVEEEKRRLEEQVQHAQRLESLGVLAGGIAHDFNNLLMAVLGHAELALDQISPMSAARGNLAEITKASRRAAELCGQMLAYAGKASFALERVGLRELVEEMAHLLKAAISKKAILNLHLEKGLPSIEADPSQIRQVVMNLIINAAEAIGDRSGAITVSVGAIRCDEEYLRKTELHDGLPPGLYVHLEVTDTGIGMDAQTRSRIFEPFFSTKFTGRGLGLAAVLGIVRAYKGALKVYSEPGKGTTFKVLFPALEAAVEGAPANGSSPLAAWRGKGTILLVDDEESLIALGARMLEHLGFIVLTAADGLQAVDLYRERGKEIDLVLMDLTMPHMDGAEAFGELHRLNPEVRVVVASGYSQENVASRFAGKSLAGVLQKPYTLAKLRESLSGLLPKRL